MDLNTASLRELRTLPDVGLVLAPRIVAARPFARVDELRRVRGIGKKKSASLAPFVAVRGSLSVDAEDVATIRNQPQPDLDELVDINTASVPELQKIPGVGPVIAQRISDARPFERPLDLLGVKGVGSETFQKMKGHVRVGGGGSDSTESVSRQQSETRSPIGVEDVASTLTIQTHSTVSSAAWCRNVERDVRESVVSWEVNEREAKNRTSAVLVASWNVRNVSKRKPIRFLERIAEIIDEFDLVALQELRDVMVLKRLKTLLEGWDFIVSDPVGRASHRGDSTRIEYLAFLFRRRVLRSSADRQLASDPDGVFTRPPFVARFEATRHSGAAGLRITAVNVHVCFGEQQDRRAEVAAIRKLARGLRSESRTRRRSVVVLGDFNLDPLDALGGKDSPFTALIRPPLTTTVHGSLYDNVWIERASAEQVEACGVYRIDWRYYPLSKHAGVSLPSGAATEEEVLASMLKAQLARAQCELELSDHCPAWASFSMPDEPPPAA